MVASRWLNLPNQLAWQGIAGSAETADYRPTARMRMVQHRLARAVGQPYLEEAIWEGFEAEGPGEDVTEPFPLGVDVVMPDTVPGPPPTLSNLRGWGPLLEQRGGR